MAQPPGANDDEEEAIVYVPLDMPKLHRCKADDEDMERLHQAVRRGNAELVQRLVADGIRVGIQNKFGCTALHLACRKGHIAVMRALAEHMPSLSTPWHGLRPVHIAVQSGRIAVLQQLVAMAEQQALDVPQFLSEPDRCEINTVGDLELQEPTSGQTALHWAIGLGQTEMLDLLIQRGANLNARDKRGYSPIMTAIEHGRLGNHTQLLELGDLTVQDARGRTCLHMALDRNMVMLTQQICDAELRNIQTAEEAYSELFLLEDEEGRSPFSTAVEMCDHRSITTMLPAIEPYRLQKMPFHDGKVVLAERIDWHEATGRPSDLKVQREREAARETTVQLLQRRLDDIMEADVRSKHVRKPTAGTPAVAATPAAPAVGGGSSLVSVTGGGGGVGGGPAGTRR